MSPRRRTPGVGRRDQDARFVWTGRLALFAMSLAMLGVLARVAVLQLAPNPRLASHSRSGQTRTIESASRGDILDRRGRPIATTAFGWRVFVDPARFPSPPDRAIVDLASAMGADPDAVGARIMPRIARNERRAAEGRAPIRYVSLGGALADDRVEAVLRLTIPGVHLERVPVRQTVPTPGLAALVGVVGAQDTGLLGAERVFEHRLAPRAGSLRSTSDAHGRTLWVEVGSYRPAVSGEPVRLSVDLAVQEIAVEELQRGITDADAAGGRVVILDPATGEVLAMADLERPPPAAVPFDASLIDRETGRGPRFLVLRPDASSTPALARNRCVEDVYEPGSTFKPFMWSAVTELGLLTPTSKINTHHGRWRTPYGRPLADVTPKGEQTWRNVLVNSSNIGMAQGVALMSHRQMRDAAIKLGFGRATGLGLPGEAAGIVTSARRWTDYTQTSVAMGYEIAVTPVQMVRAFSVFARAGPLVGTLPIVRLTAAKTDEDKDAGIIHRVFPRAIALLARDAMRAVALHMDQRMTRLGRFDAPPRYPMFAKSGTANVPRPDGKGYIEGQYISSFIAGAPAESPRIVVLVVIDDPGPGISKKKHHYGSWVAGPVVRRIVERVLPYLGVEPPGV